MKVSEMGRIVPVIASFLLLVGGICYCLGYNFGDRSGFNSGYMAVIWCWLS